MHKITLTNKITCVELEQEIGLERGDITSVAEHSGGIVDVYFLTEPTVDQKTTLQTVLNKRIMSEETE